MVLQTLTDSEVASKQAVEHFDCILENINININCKTNTTRRSTISASFGTVFIALVRFVMKWWTWHVPS